MNKPTDKIHFFYEEPIKFQLVGSELFEQWLTQVISKEKPDYILNEINYIFCNDAYLIEINKQYLDHDTYTDIITFDSSEKEGQIESDIFISIERVEENAKELKIPFERELKRVMVHGLLHLMGYRDKTVEEVALMRKKEDQAMALFSI